MPRIGGTKEKNVFLRWGKRILVVAPLTALAVLAGTKLAQNNWNAKDAWNDLTGKNNNNDNSVEVMESNGNLSNAPDYVEIPSTPSDTTNEDQEDQNKDQASSINQTQVAMNDVDALKVLNDTLVSILENKQAKGQLKNIAPELQETEFESADINIDVVNSDSGYLVFTVGRVRYQVNLQVTRHSNQVEILNNALLDILGGDVTTEEQKKAVKESVENSLNKILGNSFFKIEAEASLGNGGSIFMVMNKQTSKNSFDQVFVAIYQGKYCEIQVSGAAVSIEQMAEEFSKVMRGEESTIITAENMKTSDSYLINNLMNNLSLEKIDTMSTSE